jgi:DNA-binding NarL/FixJ family response regulator
MRTPASEIPLSILIVDDHAIVREGLVGILAGSDRGWHVAEASGGLQALDWLRGQPDRTQLAIVDLSMPGMSGFELIDRMKAEFARVRILVLSMHEEEQYALRAFQAGAQGYVTKGSAATELIDAVDKVAGGGAYVSQAIAEKLVLGRNRAPAQLRAAQQLTQRELEVLRGIVAGQRLSHIAESLQLAITTVSTHKRRIQDKLELPSLAALIRFGMAHGLLNDLQPQAASAHADGGRAVTTS